MRFFGMWAVALAFMLLGGASAVAQDDLQRASELLRSGQERRAAKLFEKVAAEGDERQILALLGAAAAHNAALDRPQAVSAAKRVLAATEEPVAQAMAQRELAVALAAGKRTPEEQREMEVAVEVLRNFLRGRPGDDLTKTLRQGLCSVLQAADLPRIVSRKPELWTEANPGDVEPPEKVHTPAPRPSKDARRRLKARSMVVLEGLIDEDGCISDLRRLESTEPYWAEIAEDTVAGWAFRPATLNGLPVPVRYKLTVNYTGR